MSTFSKSENIRAGSRGGAGVILEVRIPLPFRRSVYLRGELVVVVGGGGAIDNCMMILGCLSKTEKSRLLSG